MAQLGQNLTSKQGASGRHLKKRRVRLGVKNLIHAAAASTAVVALALGTVLVAPAIQPSTAAPGPAPMAAPPATQNPSSCPTPITLANGDFEQPVMTNEWSTYPQASVPGWNTTARDGLIEYWRSGFQGVPSYSGNQFVELNANFASALYQDIATTPGQTIQWSLAHRGRQGTDVMAVKIGTTSNPVEQQRLSDGKAWGAYSGTYTVPAGQTTTRFQFEAISSAGGNATVGNFLDAIQFGNAACLIANKTVTNLNGNNPAKVGDVLEYNVAVNNGGGINAPETVLQDAVPAGTQYQPGSLKVSSGVGAGSYTDAAGDDRAEYSAASNAVTIRLGTGATASVGGTVAPGTSTTATFRVVVTAAAAAGEINNKATVNYRDTLTNTVKTSTSQTVQTLVAAAADLQITKALVTQTPVAGSPIQYKLTVTNNGPQAATGVTAVDALPASITGGSAQIDGGATCAVNGQNISCAIGNLAVGASQTITVNGTVAAATAPGSTVTNTATVSGNEFDHVPANNTATTNTVLLNPALTVTKTAGALQDTNGSGRVDAGDTQLYNFVVRNTGNTVLNSVSVTDPKISNVSCPATTLAVNASMTCTGSYQLTQSDIDAASVTNSATAKGTPPGGSAVTSPPSQVTTPIATPSTLKLTKTAGAISDANGSGRTDAGDTIAYTFEVENTGATTLNTLSISDAKIPGVSCPVSTLAPGAKTTCTANYTLKQSDIDAAKVDNSATANAKNSSGQAVVSNISTATKPLPLVSSFSFVKSASAPVDSNASGRLDAGDSIGYSFKFTNTGTTTLTKATVADSLLGAVTCPTAPLAPGDSITCTANYTITQADMNAGHRANSATGTVTKPDNTTSTSVPSTTDTPLTGVGSLTFDKQQGTPVDVNGDGSIGKGDRIPYTFVVTNSGSVTVTGVNVVDSKVSGVSCPLTTLAPAQSTTCTGSYLITQDDVDSGSVRNTAHANGKDPQNQDVNSADDSTNLAIVQTPKISLLKKAGNIADTTGDGSTGAGDTLSYSFTVTNTGNVTVDTVTVADAKIPGVSCPSASLAPGESATCTGSLVLTQADFDAGKVDNKATASTKSGGSTVTSNESADTKPLPVVDAISIKKSAGTPVDANSSGRVDAGDTIGYSFLVTNTGNTTLTGVLVTDPKVTGLQCPSTTLAPGKSVNCTGTHTISQAEVDAGKADNSATSTGTPPGRGAVTSQPSTTSTPITQVDSLSLVKDSTGPVDSDGNGKINVGDTVPYTFVVKNTGTSTLQSVRVQDNKLSANCPAGALAPGASVTCTGSYTLTQADLNAGVVNNTATAFGTPQGGRPEVPSNQSSKSVVIPQLRSISLLKEAQAVIDNNNNGRTDHGDFIPYTFKVTNTGTVALSTLAINDPKAGSVQCPATDLAPGATVTCTATYEILQADVDAGKVVNEATATAKDSAGTTVTSNKSSVTTPMSVVASMTFDKRAAAPTDVNGNGVTDAGDTIAYTFEVTNNGAVTLNTLSIVDPKVGQASCPAGPLAPGQTRLCTATYTLTQADVNSGSVQNTAHATATDPTGTTVDSPQDSTNTPILPQTELTLQKTAGTPQPAPGQSTVGAGGTVEYTFTVKNNSTVTIKNIAINDPLVTSVSCDVTELDPGQSAICKGTYVLQTADFNRGEVHNVATAKGTAPDNSAVESLPATANVPLVQLPSLSLDKTAGAIQHQNGGTTIKAGDLVPYTFKLKNTGNTTLHLLGVNDGLVGSVQCPVADLQPNEETTCQAQYAITQADIDAGTIVNKAKAFATPPAGGQITSPEDSAVVDAKGEGKLSLSKEANAPTDSNGNGRIDVGDTVSYRFVLRNDGNVTLSNFAVTDPKIDAVNCPVNTLAPGASTTCTGSYLLTQDDLNAGKVDNTASATAKDPYGGSIDSGDSSATVPVPQQNSLTIKKSAGQWNDANNNGLMDPNETIPYSFVVTNSGTTTLSGVVVNDGLIQNVNCPATTLAPGASTTCNGSYTLKQEDVDKGFVFNSATATGTTPSGGNTTSPGSEVTTPIPAKAELVFDKAASPVKDANGSNRVDAGDVISYTFTVTNQGNVSIDFLAISDTIMNGISCPKDVLAAGETMVCVKDYTITAADLDNGSVQNTASASGLDPSGKTVKSNTDSTTTALTPTVGMTVEKSAAAPVDVNGNGFVDRGDTIEYSFKVTNTGTVTMKGLTINDPLLGNAPISCPVTDLPAGDSTTCTATYTLTQKNVDDGSVKNTATATATPPGTDVPVTSPPSNEVVVPIAPNNQLGIVKKAGAPQDTNNNGQIDPGETIAYTFTVTNLGTTTVNSLLIVDPLIPANKISCSVTTLAPQGVAECTASYPITAQNLDDGVVKNTATATGKTPNGSTVESPGSSTETPLVAADKLSISKAVVKQAGKDYQDANGNGLPDVGETITYSFTVQNTGNTSLDNVTVTDPKLSVINCPKASLAAGETITCQGSYPLTQDDINAGKVDNQAKASGTPPLGRPAVNADSNLVSTPLPQASNVSLVKTLQSHEDVNGNTLTDAGDSLSYKFVVTNTGNTRISDVKINDPLVSNVSCDKTTLNPGESAECSGSLTVTQAQVNAGKVVNTATATVTGPEGEKTSAPSTATVPTDSNALVKLVKSVKSVEDTNNSGGINAGDTVNYLFTVSNEGTLTLSNPKVVEQLPGVTVTCPSGDVQPGKSVDCEGSYTLTQADVNAGKVTNTATATATAPVPGSDDTQTVTSAKASVEQPILRNNQLELKKTVSGVVDVNKNGKTDTGDRIDYSLVATNQGNTTLQKVKVVDELLPGLNCTAATLEPGKTLVCAGSYTLKQSDVDAGVATNRATATATAPDGTELSSKDSINTPTANDATLNLKKTHEAPVDANNNGQIDAGETVKFNFTVSNDGSVTVKGIALDDPMLTGKLNCDSTVLAPGASMNCSGVYTITQQDINNGSILNQATAHGNKPDDTAVPPADATDTVVLDQKATLNFVKQIAGTHDLNNDGQLATGDSIDYKFTVKNTGNVPVSAVSVADAKLASAGVQISCPSTELAPGESVDCTATYSITQGDTDTGEVVNTAQASAKHGETKIDSVTSTATQPLTVRDGLSLEKKIGQTKDLNRNGKLDAGDSIEYLFTVKNTGTRTVTGVAVNDPLVKVTCAAASLTAGASTDCSALYTVTQADVDAGAVKNTATANGKTPDGKPIVSDPASVTKNLDPTSSLQLVKKAGAVQDANGNGRKDAGDTVSYSFTLSNTGNTTLLKLSVTDQLLSNAGVKLNCAVPTLAPGASVTCSSDPYRITAADVDAGAVFNTATATGSSNGKPPVVSPPSSVKTLLDPKTKPLPNTGVDNIWLFGAGGAVLLIGILLVVFAARRRKNNS